MSLSGRSRSGLAATILVQGCQEEGGTLGVKSQA